MEPKRIGFAWLTVAAILASSCAGLSGIVGTSGSAGTSDFDAQASAPANPLNLQVAPDAAHLASAVMATNGGTLTATGADGTKYTLEVPAGALYAPTEIRMIPAASVQGLPFGQGLTEAVQLEPDGLRFNDVVVLTIEPKTPIPVDQQVFFGFQAQGADFHLVPPDIHSTALKIPITHFSGYGVTKGFEADIEPVRARIAGDVESRLTGILANELAYERRMIESNAPADKHVDMAKLMQWYAKTFYTEVLKPRLDAAGDSCAAGQLAIQTLLGMERTVQLLGLGTLSGVLREAGLAAEANRVDKTSDLLKQVGLVCVQEEYELCRDQHIIHRIIPVALGLERQSQLLGGSESGFQEVSDKAKELTGKCLNFEVEFKSNLTQDVGGVMTDQTDMSSKVKLHFDWAEITSGHALTGKAGLTNDRFTIQIEHPKCSVTSSTPGGTTFEVIGLQWKVGYVKDVFLTTDHGVSTESYTVVCVGGGKAPSAPNSALWSGPYGALMVQYCSDSGAQGTSGNSAGGSGSGDVLGSFLQGLGLKMSDLSPDQQSALQGIVGSGGGDLTEAQQLQLMQILMSARGKASGAGGGSGTGGSGSDTSAGGLISSVGLGGCNTFSQWQVAAGETFATKDYKHTGQGFMKGAEDKGSLILYHKPQ